MDMELAVDAMELSNTVDHMVIFSGDGDFSLTGITHSGSRICSTDCIIKFS